MTTAVPPASAPVAGAWSTEAASWMPIEELENWDRNPKKNDHRVGVAMKRLRDFGFGSPMVRDVDRGWLVAGNARLKGMRKILDDDPELDGKGGTNKKLAKLNKLLRESLRGPTVRHLPVRWMKFESEAKAEAYGIVDNNQIGEWDSDALVDMVERTSAAGIEIESLGFNEDILKQIQAASEETTTRIPRRGIKQAAVDSFVVLIECSTEADQLETIEQCQEKGWKCRALI